MTEEKTKPKFDDMTLGQIKGLKAEIANKVSEYLKGVSEVVAQRFDVGAIGFDISTEIRQFRNAFGREWKSPGVTYNVDVYFSKEDEKD